MESPKERIVMWLKMLLPRFRVSLGFCPMCNSDAPELDNCPLCEGYHSAKGNDFPPPPVIKKQWLDEMRSVVRIQTDLKKAVRESRKRRLNI